MVCGHYLAVCQIITHQCHRSSQSQDLEEQTAPTRAGVVMSRVQASVPLPPPKHPPPIPLRRKAYIVAYIINFGVLLLWSVAYVVFAEKGKVLASTVGPAATMMTTTINGRSTSTSTVMKSTSTSVSSSSMETSINGSTSESYSSMWPATDLITSAVAVGTTTRSSTVSKNEIGDLRVLRQGIHTHRRTLIFTKITHTQLSLSYIHTHPQIHYTHRSAKRKHWGTNPCHALTGMPR